MSTSQIEVRNAAPTSAIVSDSELLAISQHFGYDLNDIRVMQQSVFKGMSAAGIRYGLAACKKRGLDPLSGQVSLWQKKDVVTICVTACGFASLADRSGNYGGVEAPIYVDSDGTEHKYWLWPDTPPMACKVTVLHKDGSRFEAVAYWKERNQIDGLREEWQRNASPWHKMPAHMLAKCARCDAFRLAFPQQLAELYDRDEMPADQPKDTHYQDIAPAPHPAPVILASEDQRDHISELLSELPADHPDVVKIVGALERLPASRVAACIEFLESKVAEYNITPDAALAKEEPAPEWGKIKANTRTVWPTPTKEANVDIAAEVEFDAEEIEYNDKLLASEDQRDHISELLSYLPADHPDAVKIVIGLDRLPAARVAACIEFLESKIAEYEIRPDANGNHFYLG